MKRWFALLLALALALSPAGCAKRAAWGFALETWRDADDYTARDGTLLSWYSYELPRLALVSDDAPRGAEPPEELAAARDAFNVEMEHYHTQLLEEYHDMEQLAIGDYIGNGADGFSQTGNYVEIAETCRTSRLLSVRMDGYANWGGAYPWGSVRTWSFDLGTGEFVEWYDLAKDPDAFRTALAAEVARQIRARGLDEGFFDDWEETVEHFDGCEVYLGEDALTVIFSDQVLGPHAAGMPEFTLAYETVLRYLNGYGKELVKKGG